MKFAVFLTHFIEFDLTRKRENVCVGFELVGIYTLNNSLMSSVIIALKKTFFLNEKNSLTS